MARPIKEGLDYFSVDVDFFSDIKTRRILKDCGPSAIAAIMCLLSNIYRNGYFVHWDEDTIFAVAESTYMAEDEVQVIVDKALQVGFFDSRLYEEQKVLTSRGIQKRYLNVLRTRKSKGGSISPDHDLVVIRGETPIISGETPINSGETPLSPPISTQSKVKERKVKESNYSPTTVEDKTIGLDEGRDNVEDYSARDGKSNLSRLCKWHEKLIGSVVTRSSYDDYQFFLEHMEADVIAAAIEIAASENKRTRSYINGILKSYKAEGVRNMADLARRREEFEKAKEAKRTGADPSPPPVVTAAEAGYELVTDEYGVEEYVRRKK